MRKAETTLEDVRADFDQWAPVYNPTHAWTLPKRRAARLALALVPGDRVLDLACGTGVNFPHLRQLVGDEGEVIGVDLSLGMLNVARRLIADQRWENVEVCEIDAARLPFPDGSFDKAICTFALNIIPDYVRALLEVRRVLVPRGRVVSLELGSAFRSLPCRLQRRLPHICSMDLSRDTAEAIRFVFPDVQVRRLSMGMLVLSTAAKIEPLDAEQQEMDQ